MKWDANLSIYCTVYEVMISASSIVRIASYQYLIWGSLLATSRVWVGPGKSNLLVVMISLWEIRSSKLLGLYFSTLLRK